MHELKNNIIRQILALRDLKSLELLDDVVKTLQLPDPFVLTSGQKMAIQEAESQIYNGEVEDHDEVMSKAKKWLQSR